MQTSFSVLQSKVFIFSTFNQAFPKEKFSDEEIKTIIRSTIVEALGILWYSKSSNSIIKLMQNIISQETASKSDLMIIRECAKTLGTFKLKKTLKRSR